MKNIMGFYDAWLGVLHAFISEGGFCEVFGETKRDHKDIGLLFLERGRIYGRGVIGVCLWSNFLLF